MKLKNFIMFGSLLIAAVVVILLIQQFSLISTNQENSQSLRLGTNIWSGYEPFYLARSQGHYDETAVRLVECSSASQVIRAFRNNTIEVAALTLDEALLLKADGFDIRIILVTDISHGGDVILGKPELTSLTDLRDQNIGVEHTAVGAYVLTRALQTVNMSVKDANVVPLEIDEHEQAFNEGKIDAVVTFDPVRSRLVAEGAVELFNSRQIPGEIVDVLVVRSATIKNEQDKIATLLKGWFAALQHLHDQPEHASRAMADRLHLEPSAVLESFDGLQLPDLNENLSLLGGEPGLLETAKELAQVMVEQQLLHREIEVSGLFLDEPLKQIKDKLAPAK